MAENVVGVGAGSDMPEQQFLTMIDIEVVVSWFGRTQRFGVNAYSFITKFTQLQRPSTSNIPEADNNNTNLKTVINLSSKPLTPSQTSLLAKGLKYVPVAAKINTDAFITSIESGLQQLAPNGNVDYLRHQIIDTIKQAPKPRPNLTHQERQAITELKKDDSITITEADKGKAAVIMDTPEFLQLVNNSLSDTTTYLSIQG
ncbi:uncharacterized protein [Haliotis asinina]|uniref:uncharacterized protein n=1 Tax=Haliotis asinina TaxID=109174 RepID=UPI0035321D89